MEGLGSAMGDGSFSESSLSAGLTYAEYSMSFFQQPQLIFNKCQPQLKQAVFRGSCIFLICSYFSVD